MRHIAVAVFAISLLLPFAMAQDDVPKQTLFTNVHVFDGVNEKQVENANVLVEGNLIKKVSTEPIEVDGATVIDGGGRTLMPGLIDVHWHTNYAYIPVSTLATGDMSYVAIAGLKGAEKTLMRGFRPCAT